MDQTRQSAVRLLETTADQFETGKMTWAQRNFNEGTNACIMIGLDRVAFRSNNRSLAQTAILRVLGAWGVTAAFKWNDEPGRTVGEVIDALRRAAKDLRNEA